MRAFNAISMEQVQPGKWVLCREYCPVYLWKMQGSWKSWGHTSMGTKCSKFPGCAFKDGSCHLETWMILSAMALLERPKQVCQGIQEKLPAPW